MTVGNRSRVNPLIAGAIFARFIFVLSAGSVRGCNWPGVVQRHRTSLFAGNKNERFLAYLLVRTHREGEDSVRNLQDEYTALWGITLEFEVPDWEKVFYDAVLSFWEGAFQRINNS